MRIPFDSKYRDKIESGEYKVETRNGKKVRVLCYDANNIVPVVALVTFNDGSEGSRDYYLDGRMDFDRENPLDLFIVTPEPEMSELELAIAKYRPPTDSKETIQRIAAELLALAKQQLLQSGELLTQEHHEKIMETQYRETLDGVKKNWHDYFTPQAVTDIYNAGRNDVLKEKKKIIVANLAEDKITGIQHDIIEFLSNMMDARTLSEKMMAMKISTRMNDTDLCTGDNCPIKDKCLRNQLYKRLLNNPDGLVHWHVQPQYKDEKCENYLPNKQD